MIMSIMNNTINMKPIIDFALSAISVAMNDVMTVPKNNPNFMLFFGLVMNSATIVRLVTIRIITYFQPFCVFLKS